MTMPKPQPPTQFKPTPPATSKPKAPKGKVKPSRQKNRDPKTKGKFEKKNFTYTVLHSDGVTEHTIYANDEVEAKKIYKGIHKDIPLEIKIKKREFKRREHLTDRPFKNLRDQFPDHKIEGVNRYDD